VSVLEDLQRVENQLLARMKELRPLVEEYAELERAARRLGVAVAEPSPVRSRTAHARTPRRERRQAPPGQRRQQILTLVTERPGITVREIGNELGVDPTSLYRIVRELDRAGEIVKEGLNLRRPA
jgi:hypothetical protein